MQMATNVADDWRLEETPGVDVLVIDDEESFSEGCRQTLEMGGYRAAVARDGVRGLKLAEQSPPNVVLVDLKMPGIDGLEVLGRISEIDPSTVSIIVTGHGTIDSAVESMKIGAFDFLTKPFEPEKLLETVRRGMDLSQLRKEAEAPEEVPRAPEAAEPAPADRHEALLRGLGVLGEYYSLGLEKRQLLDELAYLEAEAKYHAQSLRQVKKRERAILDIRDELRLADAIIQKHGYRKNALIQILLDIQAQFKWLPRHVLRWLSSRLNVPLADINTLANFYEAFSLKPRGAHMVQVCLGTACHVRGAPELLARVSAMLGIKPGETDSKQLFTLETVHCMGCCALGPVMQIDGRYYGSPSLKKLEKIISSFEEEEEALCLG